ncbi:YjdF family protein [Paenibacillus thiaminolyticus]|uniref:YjdF family protein n=1 Tax=Paenibacillus thiaminolyticus TaxID=49283 RepID=UPI003D2C9121
MKLTVYFEDPFWVGVVEEQFGNQMKACRHVFGAEPKDAEVMVFVNTRMNPLMEKVQSGVGTETSCKRPVNPKRLARIVAREMQRHGISSQSHDALRLELESRKKERTVRSREQREALKEKKRSIRIQKKKDKHRGR